MKRANNRNLLFVTLPLVLMYGLNWVLAKQSIDLIFFQLDVLENARHFIIGVFGLLLIIWLWMLSKETHQRYIKRQKNGHLNLWRLIAFVTSALLGYSFVYDEVFELYWLLTLILLILLYYINLKLIDRGYVQSATKSRIRVNDALIETVLQAFGGEENIMDVSYEHSRLKVTLHDVKKIDVEAIKAFGATGVFIAGNKLQAFVGTDAKELEKALTGYLTSKI